MPEVFKLLAAPLNRVMVNLTGRDESMSWQSAEEPEARTPPSCKALETVIVPRPRDIGGF